MKQRKILVRDLNDSLTCTLCDGYFVDATSIIECLHVFCRGCILRYFETCKMGCPICLTSYKKKNVPDISTLLRPDHTIQSIVYKLVPGLYAKEIQRRDDFYRTTHNRASSSCSDDSVLGEHLKEQEEGSGAGSLMESGIFFAPDDLISLSLEYYQVHLDTVKEKQEPTCIESEDNKLSNGQVTKSDKSDSEKCEGDKSVDTSSDPDRRYLQCPAAVTMSLLQKFIRMKYALSPEHNVDIIYQGEVLPNSYTLMDVAYTFKWERVKPLRFFYRIFTPMKIRPIKIINTASTTGEKQLQIVPVQSDPKPDTQDASKAELDAQTYRNKERLMAELQLKSREKVHQDREEKNLAEMKRSYHEKLEQYKKEVAKRKRSPEPFVQKKKTISEPHCVYEYEEPDKEEIKRFAEKRDREWALTKQSDDVETHHVRKRKKSKHSKNDMHKKRKLHAEITSSEVNQEESIKLKLKVTQPHNGHKHKHHKNADNQPQYEVSNKESLLQMRSVRHKSSSSENESPSTKKEVKFERQPEIIKNGEKKEKEINKLHIRIKSSEPPKSIMREASVAAKPVKEEMKCEDVNDKQAQTTFLKTFQSGTGEQEKLKTTGEAKKINVPVYSSSSLERKIANLQQQCTIEARNTPTPPLNNNNNNNKITEVKEKINPYPPGFTVSKIESGAVNKKKEEVDKRPSLEITLIPQSLPSPKAVVAKPVPSPKLSATPKPVASPRPMMSPRPASASPRPSSSPRPVASSPKPNQVLQSQKTIPRPISSPKPNNTSITKVTPNESKPMVKRPPPATIPLDRIKNKNLKSGVTIIPKMPERCDNIGALDLTKTKPETKLEYTTNKTNGVNGNGLVSKDAKMATLHNTVSKITERAMCQDKNVQLSNLQMLSKLASEQPSLNKTQQLQATQNNNNNKVRPQLTNSVPNLKPVVKLTCMPKLNEIKPGYRIMGPHHIRNMRPNQNQNIRNIPNPSLIVRQQNQNRLNSVNLGSDAKDVKSNNNVLNTCSVTVKSASLDKLSEKVMEKAEVVVGSKAS